jgi:hypothetical protein
VGSERDVSDVKEALMIEQLLLQVGGMTCTGCERRVQKVLGRLDGVRRGTADRGARPRSNRR